MSSARPVLRTPSLDQLDTMVRVASPAGWLVLCVFVIVVAGSLAWATVATAPVKVTGTGVLQGSAGVAVISAPASGPLASLDVSVGDVVEAGAVVARLANPVLDARIATLQARVEQLQVERGRLAVFQAREQDVRVRAEAERRQGLEQTLAQAREKQARLAEILASQRELLGRGLATRDRILLTESDLEQTRRDAAEATNAVNALAIEAEEREVRSERDLIEIDTRMSQGRQELAEIMAERAASTEVRAFASGRVVEIAVATGERVDGGSVLMRLVPQGLDALPGDLVGVLYVRTAEGKRVRPGMEVQLIPSTVRVERDGFIKGEVTFVSEVPATREAVRQALGNAAFVDRLMEQGPPFEVRVALKRDPATLSGFAWSSELGRARLVESGTIVGGEVVVERVRVISLVFPAFDALLHRLGIGT